MLILVTTTDTLRVITSATCDVDVVASHMDCSQATPPVMDQPETTVTNITTATTTTVAAAPGGTKRRNIKSLNIRNTHATTAVDVTVTLERSAAVYELIKVTLLSGETLEYVEGVGFFKVATAPTLLTPGNASTAAQGPGFATDTYVTGSNFLIDGRIKAASWFLWTICMSKTAASTAAPTFNVRVGTAGAVGDTSRCLFTGPVQSAVADTAIMRIIAKFNAVGASAVIQGELEMQHNLAATGFATTGPAGLLQISTTGSSFDSTPAGSIIGLSMNGGASAAWTVTTCVLAAINLLA
jgi:hypothetical protein